MGVLAFSTCYARWADPVNQRPFSEIARGTLDELQACAASLAAGVGG
jgi:hypothetical protein